MAKAFVIIRTLLDGNRIDVIPSADIGNGGTLSQEITYTGSTVSTIALPVDDGRRRVFDVYADADSYVDVGTSPVANATRFFLPARTRRYFEAGSGDKIALAATGSTAEAANGSTLTPDVASSRTWASDGKSYVEQRTLADGTAQTRTVAVRTAYQVADWTAVGAWTSTDGGIPANALTLNGEPLTLNGEYIVIQ